MVPTTLPGYVLPEGLPQPEIDMDALRRAAAPDDNSPMIVTRRYLKQVERELTAGLALRSEMARMMGMQVVIEQLLDTVQ